MFHSWVINDIFSTVTKNLVMMNSGLETDLEAKVGVRIEVLTPDLSQRG
jgi:hypothetical protein